MPELSSSSELQRLLVEAVREHNVLPLTGRCNLSCSFCSHRNNPPGTRAYSFGPLNAEILSDLAACLNPEQKIIIGESATRLREGEPLTHPYFMPLIRKLRSLYPETLLQVTTNGILLNAQIIRQLASLHPLELILSVNSISAEGRNLLMGDPNPENIMRLIDLLAGKQLDFHGSVVAMTRLVGVEDLRQTLLYLDRNGAKAIRLLLPGFTKLADPDLIPDEDDLKKVYRVVEELQQKLATPLLPEPPLVTDLHPLIAGVFKAGPAGLEGLHTGDLILEVDGRKPFSRVDAFRQLTKSSAPEIRIMRKSEIINIRLPKEAHASPGLAFDYDLDPDQVDRVKANINPDGKNLMLVSAPALVRWQVALRWMAVKNIDLLAVPADWFGGTINCAGLLTVDDYRAVMNRVPGLLTYNCIMIPAISFDKGGCDLCGKHYSALAAGGLPVKVVE